MSGQGDDDLRHAITCFDRGDLETAERGCRAVLAAASDCADAHVLLGRILQARGDLEEANAAYRAAAIADRTCVDAWRRWAGLLHAHGHSKEAAMCLREALTYVPAAFALHGDLGLILLESENAGEAAVHLENAVALVPSSISALGNLGLAYKAQGRIEDAIACYRQALVLAPDKAELHNNLGDALKTRDMDAAIASFRTALELRPDYPEALDNIGVAYVLQDKLDDALEKFDLAQREHPAFHRAIAHKTTTLFLLGRLPEAWRLHRRRFELSGVKVPPHGRFPLPVWDDEPLAGKSLLVWTEQGLGDEILQAGMFSELQALVSRLTVECTPRALTLFQRSFPSIEFIPRLKPSRISEAKVDADYQAAAGDLGAVLRKDFNAFPRHRGYLKVAQPRMEALRQKYRQDGKKLVVGISWASYNADLGKEKTLSLLDFAPILRQRDVEFVNLQYRSPRDELASIQRDLNVKITTDDDIDFLGDLDDIAAQIAAMDLVISVSNTVVHLAGALNVPVWNIVPAYNATGMWHWFHNLEHSPWYPSMKIYRRKQRDVGPLIARIAEDLRDFAEGAERTMEFH
ncbi:MAG: tetratricopeptide repeat protein [Rhodospirillaceae bacterium]|nr:tetratricopeptide repeat protein [Rhodospirillaceae bacterium]